MAQIESEPLIRLVGVFERGFARRVDDRWQTIEEFLGALARVNASGSPVIVEARPRQSVGSFWTLHMVHGRPESLYSSHALVSPSDLDNFFDGNRAPEPLIASALELREAANVLWDDIKGRAEIVKHITGADPYRHAFDHVSRFLAIALRRGPSLAWNRELERPSGRVSGSPTVEVLIEMLSAGAQAAVRSFDERARVLGVRAYEEAVKKQADWG